MFPTFLIVNRLVCRADRFRLQMKKGAEFLSRAFEVNDLQKTVALFFVVINFVSLDFFDQTVTAQT